MRRSDRTSQISILRRRRSPGGKGRLLRSLGLRRPRVLPLVAPSLLVARRRRRHRPSRPRSRLSPPLHSLQGASATEGAFCLWLGEQLQIRRKRKTKNQQRNQKSYTYLARGADFFWELGAPRGPPAAPGAAGPTPASPADGAGATTAVSACDASTRATVPAPDAGAGSAGPSGTTV